MAEKILIVDDEREITDLVALYLENERFTVFKCYTAQEAMNCIDKERKKGIIKIRTLTGEALKEATR